jgi:protein-tyrosine phosphatase
MRSDIYWIGGVPSGRLAILARPRGGDWLEDEVRAWRDAGIDVVVSLLTPEEINELDLAEEARWCAANNIQYVPFAIPDRGVPASTAETIELARYLAGQLEEGRSVGVHCRQGIGRSALMTSSVLAAAGSDVERAFESIRAARDRPVPDTPEQRAWVDRLARELRMAPSR